MLQLLFNGLDRIRNLNLDPATAYAFTGVYTTLLTALLVKGFERLGQVDKGPSA